MTAKYTEKLTIAISKEAKEKFRNLPRNCDIAGKLRNALDRILDEACHPVPPTQSPPILSTPEAEKK